MKIHGYDYLLTAHHADDDLETFFINLSRGTGLRGLTGIPEDYNRLLRPLLAFTRFDILNLAKKEEWYWREDSSNVKTEYLRNELRHEVLPSLKKVNTNWLKSFQNYWNEELDALESFLDNNPD